MQSKLPGVNWSVIQNSPHELSSTSWRCHLRRGLVDSPHIHWTEVSSWLLDPCCPVDFMSLLTALWTDRWVWGVECWSAAALLSCSKEINWQTELKRVVWTVWGTTQWISPQVSVQRAPSYPLHTSGCIVWHIVCCTRYQDPEYPECLAYYFQRILLPHWNLGADNKIISMRDIIQYQSQTTSEWCTVTCTTTLLTRLLQDKTSQTTKKEKAML
jgi:hypothetical protein